MKRLWLAALWLAAGCAAPPASPSATPRPAPTLTPASTRTLAPSATPRPTATVPPPTVTATATLSPTPTRVPVNFDHPRLEVFAANLPGPDDLALAPDGSIFLSDVRAGTVQRFTADGAAQTVLTGLNEPEGLAFLPDGALVIVEQGLNRLVRYDFQTQTLTPLLTLENTTGHPGVDGLAADAAGLLIPDSPHGRILRAAFDGTGLKEIARGFGRPAGLWPEAAGTLLVADENTGWLSRLGVDGTVTRLALLPVPDDVVADAWGNIYAVTLQDGAVHVLPAGADKPRLLLGDLKDPQGLCLDAAGDLIVAEAGRGRLARIIIH